MFSLYPGMITVIFFFFFLSSKKDFFSFVINHGHRVALSGVDVL